MKKIIARIAVILMLATGFTAIGSVANAAPAHAGTASQCFQKDAGAGYVFWSYSSAGRYAAVCYVDYDWFEEVVLGYRDGWKIMTVHPWRCGGTIPLWVRPCY